MKVRIFLLIISFCFINSILALGAKIEFSDLPETHWAYEYIYSMVDLGILEGYPDGTFLPDKEMSRAEFSTLLTQSLDADIIRPKEPTFNDVLKTHWAYRFIETSKPFFHGFYDSNNFYPQDPALREDVASAIVRVYNLENTQYDESILNQFADSANISVEKRKLVAICIENEFMLGTDLGFEPKKALTRAEACTVLSRALKLNELNITPTLPDKEPEFTIIDVY